MTNGVVRVLAIPDHLLACGYSTLDTKSADEEYPFFDIKSKFRIGHWFFFFSFQDFLPFFRGEGEGEGRGDGVRGLSGFRLRSGRPQHVYMCVKD